MLTADPIRTRILAKFPEAKCELIPNEAPNSQPSLLLGSEHAFKIAQFLRDDPELRLDYLSNVTGVDFLDAVLKDKIKTKKVVDGVVKEV